MFSTLKDKYSERQKTESDIRKKYSIPDHAECVVSPGIKEITAAQKHIESMLYGFIASALASPAGTLGIGVGALLGAGINEAMTAEVSPNLGYYVCIKYTFSYDYCVITGNAVDDHSAMECQQFTHVLEYDEFFDGGQHTYSSVTINDPNYSKDIMGLYTYACPLNHY